ncbi:MAG: FtsX-like permease family protein [Mogibacterium sp.]|nr:FtsX-like permease family protein [Mogibacterium sp.]
MLKKSTLREIKTSLARYLAIFAIVALGVGFFSGLRDCKASMVSTATRYINEHNMFDYQLISTYGIDDESVEMAKQAEGVSGAEGSVQVDVLAESGGGDEAALKAISLPENINTLRVVTGRLPEAADECVVDDYHIDSEGYRTGDTIVLTDSNDEDTLEQFRSREYKIVGTVNTPVYLDYQRGSTDIGNGSLETFFFIDRDSFDTDYYTQLYLTLDGDERPFTQEKEDRLEAAEDSMKALAEKITAARRQTAMADAQEELDEKKQEYEENLAKYEDEKAKAEREMDKAEAKLNKGQKQINSARKKAKSTQTELEKTEADLNGQLEKAKAGIEAINSEKAKAEAGLAKANAGRAQLTEAKAGLEQQLAQAESADEPDQQLIAEIKGKIAGVDTQIAGIDQDISNINKGISEDDSKLAEIEAGKKQLEDGISQVEGGLEQTQDGLSEISRQQKKIDQGRRTLNSERNRAETEFEKAERELDDAKDKLDEAQEKIDDMELGNSYALSRLDNAGYSSFDSNSSIVSNIAKIFPVFFFLIAALVCMTTMTRMIDEQRTQIGILKALGYSNAQIVGKYMFYSGSAAFLGAVTGFFIGCKVFPAVIWDAYTMMYDFSDDVDYIIDPKLGLISLTAALLCSMGATWVSISRDFKVAPSELIRPKTPPAGKRILLERIKPLWSKISFLYKVSIRNIFRDKKRFLMMVIGVSGCTALLIAGIGIRTTVGLVAEHQFNEISLYDFNVVFSKNMTAARQADFLNYMKEEADVSPDEVFFMHQAEVSVESGSTSFDVSCTAADPGEFGRFIDLHAGSEPVQFPGDGEVVIVKKINHDYGINTGDTIKIRDGFREAEFTVSGVSDNYVYDSVYMSMDTYEKAFGKKAEIKTALVQLKGGQAAAVSGQEDESTLLSDEDIRAKSTEAANYEHTAAVSVTMDVKDSVAKMMESLDLVVYVVILSAALLAFIVLYNLTNINITERIREIATIKVLGFNQLEVSQYVFRENLFLTAIAAVVGMPLGKWLLAFVIDNIVVKMIYFEPRVTNLNILTAVALTFAFAAFVNLAMQRRLRNVSMTESLKSVE